MGPEIGLAFSALSGIMGAVGSMQQAGAAKAQAEYQAQVARNNETIARQNAQYAAAAGESQAQAQDFKNRATLGAIEAAQSASGLDLDSPTLRQVREGSAQVLRLDTANVMANAALRARGYEAQAQGFASEGELARMRARSQSGGIGAFGSLLSGASSFADKWTRYQSPSTTTYGSWSPR